MMLTIWATLYKHIRCIYNAYTSRKTSNEKSYNRPNDKCTMLYLN